MLCHHTYRHFHKTQTSWPKSKNDKPHGLDEQSTDISVECIVCKCVSNPSGLSKLCLQLRHLNPFASDSFIIGSPRMLLDLFRI